MGNKAEYTGKSVGYADIIGRLKKKGILYDPGPELKEIKKSGKTLLTLEEIQQQLEAIKGNISDAIIEDRE